uniref:Amino acid/amide ABC transporter membrane protein 2, HAAT family n=1 Tax=Candidatus Kentrum sp. MB TaxID=2138164 RepID=A0A450X5X2_9GAMM|nr:MAG: amino acid/amide ABC transporter membrane protein 2, HAAT family [Candidatus Kentron sp. MB]VFK27027.1 MAG: amino acid/amide ABC transporter membrane protein 2, HAAT family [Candidatus Kentron sp. MB]VFK74935.1 MAG: amino acid/amide ABC transporter membrane protein 2, HAAT family [Candidatus Kentron sp. MB]
MENYLLHILVMIGIYSILAYSMNLLTGFGGLLAFCLAGFYGIGAYAHTLLRVGGPESAFAGELLFSAALPFPLALVGAALAGGLAAFLMGLVALRFRRDFFIFTTLGFQMIVFVILYNWTELGRGAFGIYGIPRPDVFGWEVRQLWGYVVLVGIVNALILPILFVLYRSPFGLSLKALRDNERSAESLGISAFQQYLSALVIAGACSGIAGGLFASYVTYIDPTSFGLKESIFIVSLLLLGGSGNIRGPILGVIVMILLPEILRFAGLPDSIAPNMREILYGLILILLMYWRPKGLLGDFALR